MQPYHTIPGQPNSSQGVRPTAHPHQAHPPRPPQGAPYQGRQVHHGSPHQYPGPHAHHGKIPPHAARGTPPPHGYYVPAPSTYVDPHGHVIPGQRPDFN